MQFKPHAALIVIDMQNDGLIHPKSANRGRNDDLIQRVQQCIMQAKENGLPVVNVLHTFKNTVLNRLFKQRFISGTEGAKLHPDVFGTMMWDLEIGKSVGSAFSNPELECFLQSKVIQHLYIVGLDAKFCVQATAKEAVQNGYETVILTDLVLTHNKEQEMPKLIKQYEMAGILVDKSDTM